MAKKVSKITDNHFQAQLKINKIHCKQFSFRELSEEDSKNFDRDQIKMNLNLNMRLNGESKTATVSIDTAFYYIDLSNELFDLKFFVEYFIQNLDELTIIEEEGKRLPSKLTADLINTAFSTGRGIVMAKTAGTNLQEFYLPLISIDEFENSLKYKKEGQ